LPGAWPVRGHRHPSEVIEYHVSDNDADAVSHAPLRLNAGVALGRLLDGALDRVYHAADDHEKPTHQARVSTRRTSPRRRAKLTL
jgi:hypothetical protein